MNNRFWDHVDANIHLYDAIFIIVFLLSTVVFVGMRDCPADEVTAEEMLACPQYDTTCWDSIHQRMHILNRDDLQQPRTIHVEPIKDWNRLYDFIMQKYYHRFSM